MQRNQRRAQSMKTVAGLAGRATEEAAQALNSANQQWQQECEKLKQLQDYRDEYREGMRHNGPQQGWQVRQMVAGNAFLNRLSKLVMEQERLVQAYAQAVQQRQQQWLALKQRAEAVDKLRIDAEKQVQAIIDRREEMASNETAVLRSLQSRR